MRWPRGVRARLAGALVLLVAVTAIALGVTTTVFVEARLRQQAQMAADRLAVVGKRLASRNEKQSRDGEPALHENRPDCRKRSA